MLFETQKKMYVETEKEFKNSGRLSCFYLRKNLDIIKPNQVIFFFLYLSKNSLDTKMNKKFVDLTTEQKVLQRKLSNNPSYIMKNYPRTWSMEDRYKWLYTKKRYLGWADLEISADNLRITYTGHGKSDEDAAGIRTNNSITLNKTIFYFEIRILSIGRNGFIGIGLADQDANLDRLPGWEKNSLGYHGDDGYAFRDSGTGIPYGPCYGKNDIVGLCVNFLEKIVFFTKNGFGLKNAFYKLKFCQLKKLYPFVGLRTKGESIEANFGSKIYEFDVNNYQFSFQTRYMTKFLRYHRKISLYDGEKNLATKLPSLTLFLLFLETGINVLFSKKKILETKHIEKKIQDLDLMESFSVLFCDIRKYNRVQKYKKIINLLSCFFAYKKEMCRNFSEYFAKVYFFTKHEHKELRELKYEALFQFLKICCVSLQFSLFPLTKTYFTVDFSVICKNSLQIARGRKKILIKKILNQFFCLKTNRFPQSFYSLKYFLDYCQIVHEKLGIQQFVAELLQSSNFIIKQKLRYVKKHFFRKTPMFASFSCSNQFFVFQIIKKWII